MAQFIPTSLPPLPTINNNTTSTPITDVSTTTLIPLSFYNWSTCTLLDFTILKTVSLTSRSIVKVVLHVPTGKKCIYKMINRSDATKSQSVSKHVLKEKEILAELYDMKYCVVLYRTLVDENHLYFVLEYLPSVLASHCYPNNIYLTSETIRFYLSEICLALLSLHKKSIMHRDIKISNICITSSGHIKLIDFGMSINSLSSNSLCGTTRYFSPEKLLNLEYNNKSEWWSFGCLIYELIIGKPPYYNINEKIQMDEILNTEVDLSNIELEVADLISKLLRKDPNQRMGDDTISSHPYFIWNKKNEIFDLERQIDLLFSSEAPLFDKDAGYEPPIDTNEEIIDQSVFASF